MSDKTKSLIKYPVAALVVAVFWFLLLPVPTFIYWPYDAVSLALFAHRIADADSIVGTYVRSQVTVTITGDDARKIVRGVSSASSGRPRPGTDWANIYSVKVSFFKGSKILEDIETDGTLFLIHHSQPPFRYDTELLHDLVYKPLSEATYEMEMKKFETQ